MNHTCYLPQLLIRFAIERLLISAGVHPLEIIVQLYVEGRLDRSNLFGFFFLCMLAGGTTVDAEYAVGVAAVVDFDERNVRAAVFVVVAVVSNVIDVVEIGLPGSLLVSWDDEGPALLSSN